MAETDYLKLYKKDPILDRNDTFNITTMLNDNWDKINAESKRVNELTLNLTDNKADKEIGKGLSTNDYTTEDKDKLAEIEAEANKYIHPATHDPSIIKQDTNNRFVTDTEKTRWNKVDDKVDKVLGKGLSKNDYSDLEKQKVEDNKTNLESHKADYANFKNNIEAVRYVGKKLELKINGEWIEHKSSEGFRVGNVINFVADEDDMQVTLTLQDPPNTTIEDSAGNIITISEWGGTMIKRGLNAYPVDETDGELVVDYKQRDKYKVNGFIDSGLINDKEYFYMAFPYTEDGIFTVDSANRIVATPTEIDPNSWRGIQKIVRKGLTNDFFNVGDQLMSNYGSGQITWEVIGIDVDTPAESGLTHSMTLQTKDCLHNVQFDAPEPSNSDSNRRSYGNNRYIHSAIKQWLNSNEPTFNWQSQHSQDAKPTGSLDVYNGPGFLNKLDPELVAILGPVSKKVAKASIDGGGQDIFTDKIFLLSPKEAGYTPSEMNADGDYTGEIVYPYYNGVANASRIKQLNGSPRMWWLRSPDVSYSYTVRSVYPDGSLISSSANNTGGVAPACVII